MWYHKKSPTDIPSNILREAAFEVTLTSVGEGEHNNCHPQLVIINHHAHDDHSHDDHSHDDHSHHGHDGDHISNLQR